VTTNNMQYIIKIFGNDTKRRFITVLIITELALLFDSLETDCKTELQSTSILTLNGVDWSFL